MQDRICSKVQNLQSTTSYLIVLTNADFNEQLPDICISYKYVAYKYKSVCVYMEQN